MTTNKTPQQKVAELIRKERTNRNWTREDLAEKLNVSKLTIKNWESGSDKITTFIMPENTLKLERLFNLNEGSIYDVYYESQQPISTYRKFRILSGFTAFGASKRLGVSDATITRWEIGDSQPNANAIVAMAKLYGVTPNELLKFDKA